MGDTVGSICDLSHTLYNLPSNALGGVLADIYDRQPLEGAGPVDMLKVFIAEHLADDVEDTFGAYDDRKLSLLAGKDFMLTLTYNTSLGSGALQANEFITERLRHWNGYYEVLLVEHARRLGDGELLSALTNPPATPPGVTDDEHPRKWWQFWK